MDTIWIELTLVVVAILANGFFAGSENALVTSRIGRLAQLRVRRVLGASAAIRLKESVVEMTGPRIRKVRAERGPLS